MHEINRPVLVKHFRYAPQSRVANRQTLFSFAAKIQLQQTVNPSHTPVIPIVTLSPQYVKQPAEPCNGDSAPQHVRAVVVTVRMSDRVRQDSRTRLAKSCTRCAACARFTPSFSVFFRSRLSVPGIQGSDQQTSA